MWIQQYCFHCKQVRTDIVIYKIHKIQLKIIKISTDADLKTSLEYALVYDSDLTMPTLIGVMTGGELPDNIRIQDGGGLVLIA